MRYTVHTPAISISFLLSHLELFLFSISPSCRFVPSLLHPSHLSNTFLLFTFARLPNNNNNHCQGLKRVTHPLIDLHLHHMPTHKFFRRENLQLHFHFQSLSPTQNRVRIPAESLPPPTYTSNACPCPLHAERGNVFRISRYLKRFLAFLFFPPFVFSTPSYHLMRRVNLTSPNQVLCCVLLWISADIFKNTDRHSHHADYTHSSKLSLFKLVFYNHKAQNILHFLSLLWKRVVVRFCCKLREFFIKLFFHHHFLPCKMCCVSVWLWRSLLFLKVSLTAREDNSGERRWLVLIPVDRWTSVKHTQSISC